ncbi:MAG: valine--tRNA ligase [Candidatus Marinimicrobia bacterium]|nr:valine--tRNA ligase [Candidatus Neomarinimicrobiota bacterium]
MTTELEKRYNPQIAERKWYEHWNEMGHFRADENSDKPKYCITIPPPNVTGMLTMGHVLNNTMQDILIRRARQKGMETLWLPGTDHASIATEAKVTKMLKEKGINKRKIGREKFLEHAWEWKEKFGGIIIEQLKRLGASCDWEREVFTMDENYSRAVLEAFVRLYNDGLIYRGERIINWDPVGQTALSDEEVIYREHQSKLWYFKYPYKDGSGHVIVATTRPETMLGDTGIAVNPNDKRYKSKIGKSVILPIQNREIPIFADSYVDLEFGTGAVKVTPAHDPNDFEMGQRHNLDIINVMNPDATMNAKAGKDFIGLTREEARELVLEKLESLNLIEKIEDYTHSVGHSERTDAVVEPYLSKQWFISMEKMAKDAKQVVKDGTIKFHPKHWEKTYFHWLDNIRDWCISRQLWWGHRIPIWYCETCEKTEICAIEKPQKCPNCGKNENLRQDSDVLDTWSSSWLWPFATMGWPQKTQTQKKFYPTDLIITGPDIIFFWIARMIMAGLQFKNEIPFTDVYFTGIIRDGQGRKMSKSLGNSPDPIDLFEKYGADAIRFGLMRLAPQGLDILFSEEKMEEGRNFMNKLWNASRFVLMNAEKTEVKSLDKIENLEIADRWILSRLNHVIVRTDKLMDDFKFDHTAKALYEFIWAEFCDWYIEMIKERFFGDDAKRKEVAISVAMHVLKNILKLMHAYTPFATEEIWQKIKSENEPDLIIAEFPEVDEKWFDDSVEKEMKLIVEVATALRNLRGEMNVPPGKKIDALFRGDVSELAIIKSDMAVLKLLAKVENLEISENGEAPENCAKTVAGKLEIFIPMAGLVDLEAERSRLSKEIEKTKKLIQNTQGKLSNENFISRAPEEVVNSEREKIEKYREKLAKLEEHLRELGIRNEQ